MEGVTAKQISALPLKAGKNCADFGFSILHWAFAALSEALPQEKALLTLKAAEALKNVVHFSSSEIEVPSRPARPEKPALCRPGAMSRRRKAQSREGRIALLHALAHIELNAIDLAWDIILRFHKNIPEEHREAFVRDWLHVAADEARHFLMIDKRLADYETQYGDLPAHDGLWETAQNTADDLLARLAIVPLVHEARGLDVTPAMISQLLAAGDGESAALLQTIHDEEIAHVEAGYRWFHFLCDMRGLPAQNTWKSLVKARFTGSLKPPFNDTSRQKAGMEKDWYEGVIDTATN